MAHTPAFHPSREACASWRVNDTCEGDWGNPLSEEHPLTNCPHAPQQEDRPEFAGELSKVVKSPVSYTWEQWHGELYHSPKYFLTVPHKVTNSLRPATEGAQTAS